ncbi:hypothetical protein K438DRAFT_1866979 [Mycena galopus ATCC 62051]|nr:hypothetical protein K438DRAFT_1866979 [Mycena galopus ATCC 62051]
MHFSDSVLPERIAASNPNPQLQSSLFRFAPDLRIICHLRARFGPVRRPVAAIQQTRILLPPRLQVCRQITLALLLTCRQIYLEARLLPVAVNDHIFWQGSAPPGKLVSNYSAYFRRMSDEQRILARHARFFAGFQWLHYQNSSVLWPAGLALHKITITVPPTGWFYTFEDDYEDEVGVLWARNPAKSWGGWVGNMATLQELEVELESERCEQLEARALKACRWIFPLTNGGCLVHDGAEPTKRMRLVSSRLDPAREYEDSWPDHQGSGDECGEGYDRFNQTNWVSGSVEGSDDSAAHGMHSDDEESTRSWEDCPEEDEARSWDDVYQANLDRKYPLDFVIYVRTLKFVKDITGTPHISLRVPDSDSD